MRFEDTVLRPGEFAIYLDTNGTIELGRLLAFLDCFRWINDDGLVPAYDLEVVDFQKKCIFARFGFKWRDGKGPDEGRLSKMEREIAVMREQMAGTTVRMADAADAQVDIARKMMKVTTGGILVSAAIGVAGLILDVARDMTSGQPTECATAAANLMQHDHVGKIRIWSPDCTIIIEQRDIPEMERRARGIYAGVGMTPPFSTASDRNFSVEHLGEDMTQAPDTEDEGLFNAPFGDGRFGGALAHQDEFPTSMHFASGNDRPPRGRSIDGARPAGPGAVDDVPPIPQLRITTAPVVTRKAAGFPWKRSYGHVTGRVAAVGEAYEMRVDMPPNEDEDLTILMPRDTMLITGRRYRLTGTLFETHDAAAIFVADSWTVIDQDGD